MMKSTIWGIAGAAHEAGKVGDKGLSCCYGQVSSPLSYIFWLLQKEALFKLVQELNIQDVDCNLSFFRSMARNLHTCEWQASILLAWVGKLPVASSCCMAYAWCGAAPPWWWAWGLCWPWACSRFVPSVSTWVSWSWMWNWCPRKMAQPLLKALMKQASFIEQLGHEEWFGAGWPRAQGQGH